MPRAATLRGVQPRLPSLLTPPIGFAHRGARAHAPENTLEAFALAVRLGATGIETDAWSTADGVVVLDHDGVVRSGMRKRPFADLTRAELPGHVPSLADLLHGIPPGPEGLHVSIDCKDDLAGPLIIAEVRDRRPELLGRIWLCHPDLDALVALRRLDPTVRLVHSTRLKAMRHGPERHAAALARADIDGVNLHHSEWTGGLTTLFHRFERTCFAWDLQHEHLLVSTLRMGVDAVFSDWVDRMVDALAAYPHTPGV